MDYLKLVEEYNNRNDIEAIIKSIQSIIDDDSDLTDELGIINSEEVNIIHKETSLVLPSSVPSVRLG